jgi:hypothetical protein
MQKTFNNKHYINTLNKFVMQPIIFDEQKALVQQQINALQERRATIYDHLEGLREAVEQLLRVEPTYPQLEPFLVRPHVSTGDKVEQGDRRAVQTAAFKVYLEREGNPMGIRPESAADALAEIPREVSDVLSAWDKYSAGPDTSDPSRYWSDTKQKFRALPVTDKEKDAIAERNRLSVSDEDRLEIIQFASTFAKILNLSAKNNFTRTTPADLKENFPFLVGFLKWKLEGSLLASHRYIFSANVESLCMRGEDFTAFDEL